MSEFPEALIEQAARVLDRRTGGHMGSDSWRATAVEVLKAVAPAIRAQALRDAAESPECRTQRDYEWLNERADQITKENS